MNNTNPDFQMNRKAAQRSQIMVALTILVIGCVGLGLGWISQAYVKPAGTAIPIGPAAQTVRSPGATDTYEPVVAPTSSPPSPTPTQATVSRVDERLLKMSLPEKVGQMIFMGLGGKELTTTECQIIRQVMPGGIVFTGGNVTSPEQLRRLITDLKTCAAGASPIPLFFGVDHEGQYINRFRTGMTIFPSAQALGATGDPAYAFRVALAGGQELSSTGINMVLGPVADVLSNLDNTVIGERSFGGDPQLVGQFVAQAVKGYRQAGLIPVLKHFPGHGGTSTDSHLSLPVDNATLEMLLQSYFPPFSDGLNAGAPSVMVGHIALPQIDPSSMPASLSSPILELLRGELGFKGVVMSDALNMGALQSTGLDMQGVALASAQAGVDLLIIPSAVEAQGAGIKIQQAVDTGKLPLEQVDNAVRRILFMKEQTSLWSAYPEPAQPDWAADQALANEVGYHSVAVLRNTAGLIPIPEGVSNILVITPPDIWGLDTLLDNALRAKGCNPRFVHYPDPSQGVNGDEAMITSFSAQAANADLTIILTWQAHPNRVLYSDNWQARLVLTIQQNTPRLVVVGLKSPTDILEFPEISTYMATFGTTEGQKQALADILVGKIAAFGTNPLPQLP